MGNIYHEWNGTVLTITSDSGTSSCDLKGDTGDMGIRGAQGEPGIGIGPKGDPGKDGAKIVSTELTGQDANGGNIYTQIYDDGSTTTFTAPKGNDGYTPQKGIDYFDGENGKDGDTPLIKINDTTKNWEISYDNGATWSDSGVKALGEDGEDGKDAITPQVRINNTTKMWEVSYDNGSSWTSTGVKAEGTDYILTEDDKAEIVDTTVSMITPDSIGAITSTGFFNHVLMNRSKRILQAWCSDIGYYESWPLKAYIRYRRVNANSGYLDITIAFQDTSGAGSLYEFISLAKIGGALGVVFKPADYFDVSATWQYIDGSAIGNAIGYSTFVSIGTDGRIGMGRVYDTNGSIGGWGINFDGISGHVIQIQNLYVEEEN